MGFHNAGYMFPGLNFPIYSGWNMYTPVIPKLYWDVYSAEQRMKQLCMNFDKVEHYLDYVAETMNQWNIEFTVEMEKEFAKLWEAVNGDFQDEFDAWFEENIESYIEKAIKMVYFGLTLDGHFVAYIPESWNDIQFDTGAVWGSYEYGRLILLFNVDNGEPVNPDLGDYYDDFGTLNNNLMQLEQRVENNENTLYNPITESEV